MHLLVELLKKSYSISEYDQPVFLQYSGQFKDLGVLLDEM